MTKKIPAIILARGGSKGIPQKNIRRVLGKHLIAYTIEAALGSKYVAKTIVSSDDDKILAIARRYGADIIVRPSKLASDSALAESSFRHAILDLQKKGESSLYSMLLQPTSPLRGSRDIDSAVELLFQKQADALISVYEPFHNPHKSLVVNRSGYLDGLVGRKKVFTLRQNLPIVYYPNGAIYIIKTDQFLIKRTFLIDKTIHFLMPPEKSIDVDTLADLRAVAKALKKAGPK